jgi:ankyrin repeat protein
MAYFHGTPLHIAAVHGKADFMKVLLEQHADVISKFHVFLCYLNKYNAHTFRVLALHFHSGLTVLLIFIYVFPVTVSPKSCMT